MLVGRASERRTIARLVAAARVGSSGVLLVSGEPGIGKTVLLDEAVALATDMRVLRARGAEAEREVPFGGLAQLLRPALGELDRIPGPQRDALASALALRQGPADRFTVGAATLSLLCRYAEHAPLALVVDDAHLLDRPSAEALLFTARRLLADPVVLLLAARTGEPHALAGADLPELVLTGVDLATAQEIVRRAGGRPVAVDLVARLHRVVAGNPLALLELADDPHRAEDGPPGAPVRVSAVLAAAFAARAERLGAAARSALLVAATEGGDLAVVAAACTALGVDVGALAEAETGGLVTVDGGRVEFRHPLIRSAVYTSADAARRRDAHRAVAAALPPDEDDRRAWHLSEAVLGLDDGVAAALEAAARRAAGRGAHAVAATAFERSARFGAPGAERARRLTAAGSAAWAAGLPDRADRLLAEALDPPPPLPVRTRVHELRGDIAVKCGSPAAARDMVVAAADEAAAADPDGAVGLLVDAVLACLWLADAASAVRAGEQIALLLPRTAPHMRRLGTMAVGMSHVLAGRGGADLIRDAVAALATADDEGADDPRRTVLSVLGPLFLRESDAGRALVERTMQRSRDRTALAVLPTLLFHLARDQATSDRWADAEATYDEAARLARETGQTTNLALALAGSAWLHAHQGRADECRSRAAEAVTIAGEHGILLGTAWSWFALGDLELGHDDPAAALAHYERLVAELDAGRVVDADLSPAPELVEVHARLGHRADAERLAAEFAEVAAAKGQPWSLARAARACGVVAPDDALDAHFRSALSWHDRTVDAFEGARTRLTYGVRLRRAARRVDARAQLRLAVATFDELGASSWADRAAAELRATGETARRRGPGGTVALTPQERRIASLLAAGRTTRQTAAAMFVSPKTVEYHLRNVYNKLGIHSRTELGAALGAERGADRQPDA